jgi:hypothetical protein
MEFQSFGKIPRLTRDCTITEKIDGTNAAVVIVDPILDPTHVPGPERICYVNGLELYAQSRTRFVTPRDDNAGFAKWVLAHAAELTELGVGHHFGEWWGQGIQRGYAQDRKRFSLFNTHRWNSINTPDCCSIVPVLYEGPFSTTVAEELINELRTTGSRAALDYMNPEGIMIYHHHANQYFKKTLRGDIEGKSNMKEAA